MQFMMLVKATERSEAGEMPTEQELTEMGAYNEEMVEAGVMRAGEGLHPSSKGVRLSYGDGEPRVTEGPFAEPEQLVAGFWLIEVDSLEEAIGWAKKIPFEEGEVEIRQVFESEDFGEEFTPELREQEERQRERMREE